MTSSSRRWEEEEFEPLPSSMPAFGTRRALINESEDDDNAESDDGLAAQMEDLDLSHSESDVDGSGEEEEEEELVLPEHACTYCGLSDTGCVARCNGCKKWFCNQLSQSSGSHIIQHLVKSRHKEISLHPDSPVGDAILECYNCGCRNIFLLGFIPAKADTVVVLLCRTPCASSGGGGGDGDGAWDVASWEPLISNRALLSWLVRIPEEKELLRCRKVTAGQIGRLEDVWRVRPDATLEDMDRVIGTDDSEHLESVRLQYSSPFDYQEVLAPLITLEAEYDRQLKEGQRIEGVTIRWSKGLNQQQLAYFTLPNRSSDDLRMALGDELVIKHETVTKINYTGIIIRNPLRTVVGTEELCVEIKQHHQRVAEEITTGFSVEFVWKATSYDRMHAAMRQLAVDESCVHPSILQQLLGHAIEDNSMHMKPLRKVAAPGLPELNHSQEHAVRSVMARPLALIQGPPGTGKTVTSATIVYHLAALREGPILVTAPSNVAVDHLTEKIHRTGLRVVRIVGRWREDLDTAVSFLSLHEQVKNDTRRPELQKLLKLRDTRGELSRSDEDRYLKLVRQSELEILKAAEVICCTCVGAGDYRLKGFKFRAVILDEATQALEPEALIPVVHGARQLVLIGDHRQLGPVILNKRAAKAGLGQSLFERLIALGQRPIRLQVQYRMHPCLSEFPSNTFYDGSLQNGVTIGERLRPSLDFPWPSPSNPMFFLSCGSPEEMSASATSYLNRQEATQCEKIVTRFLKAGILPSQIGVITPYDGQRAFIQQHMQMTGPLRKDLYTEVEVASVDAFQGREKDYIILSCVRSNDHQGIGFLSDPRRLNVALTRAKFGMVILGNPRVLARHPLWYHLVQHFREKSLLMEGSLAALRPSLIQLLRPRENPRAHAPPPFQYPDHQQHQQALKATGITAEALTRSPFDMPFFSQDAASMAARAFLGTIPLPPRATTGDEGEHDDLDETYSQL